jgi:hypothetical protein
MEAHVTAHSQADWLRERMVQAEVQHGQEIRADLPGIAVKATAGDWFITRHKGRGEVFFCTMGPIRVREVTSPGDGATLPNDVIIEGFEVASAGTYDLLNVLVQSNGNLRIVVDDATRVVPVAKREISHSDLTFA